MNRFPSLIKQAAWFAAIVLLSLNPLDPWLDSSMPRVVLLQMPAWFVLGWIQGRKRCWRLATVDPNGLGAFALAIFTIIFWMIPRSIDAVGSSDFADSLLHVSMLIAGFSLAVSFTRLPFVGKAAFAIMGASKVFALGIFYSKYTALLCGSFSLAQQKELGAWLLRLTPFMVVWAVAAVARMLIRQKQKDSPAAEQASASPVCVS